MNARALNHPLERSKLILDGMTDAAFGICALGDLLEIADPTKINDAILTGLGMLLKQVGHGILVSAGECEKLIDTVPI